MRLRRLEIQNFKGFAQPLQVELPEMFNLLVGANGTGKTNILDAAAVALGVWLVDPPDTTLLNSKRPIFESEIHISSVNAGDRIQFQESYPVSIKATGDIGDQVELQWTAQIRDAGSRGSRPDSDQAHTLIRRIYAENSNGKRTICPVVAYYGAGRAWLPSNERSERRKETHDVARRWDAFYDAFSERIRFSDLVNWFRSEFLAAINRKGKLRPGFEAVKLAIIKCVPGAENAWYDEDQKDIVLSIDGYAQPMKNLSAGQRMMLAMIGDLAIRCVTQNAQLLPPDDLQPQDDPLPRVFAQTPGVVLIDELDLHLHPAWQRRIAHDLKTTFPNVQFICTTHSPQIIGEVMPSEVQLLHNGALEHPAQSFGMDTNWILNVLMKIDDSTDLSMNKSVQDDLDRVHQLLAGKNIVAASEIVANLRQTVGNSYDVQRAASSIERVNLLGK